MLEFDPSDVPCFEAAPRPDVIIAISGCHYEGGSLDLIETESWGNGDASLELIAGAADTDCPAWQSKDAADEIRAAGYPVRFVTLEGADHLAPIFRRIVGDEMVPRLDDPPGSRLDPATRCW